MNAVGLDVRDRKQCYEIVSRKNLGEMMQITNAARQMQGRLSFFKAMKNPGFISANDKENLSSNGV